MSIFDEPVLETAPDADLTELLEATAANAEASGAPPLPRYAPQRAPAEQLGDSWGDEEPQRRGSNVRLPSATRQPGDTPPEPVQEAAVWKTDDHPRWPHGTPGGKGGEFIRVGEFFNSGGKRWQVAHIVKGRIYAHEASAKYGHVETKSFDVGKEAETGHAIIPGAEHHAPTSVPKGGKSTASEITIVDPYVDHASHDPSIPIPTESSLTPEQWKRFGKLDQEHYTELMERFGKHKPGGAKSHVDASYGAYTAKVQQLVKSGYQAQYGSSSGYSLSIAAGQKHSYGGHGVTDTPEMAKLRQECLALQAEHKAAVQWDLYNRTKSPDMLVVHKDSSNGPQWWEDQFIKGDKPIMSGLSQSFAYRRGFFGSHGVATPLAIRHVLLSSASAQPVPGASHFPGELEISVMEQMKYDKRSLALSAAGSGKHTLTGSQISWLEGMTNEPVGGHVLEQLRDAIDTGTYLPPPPKPPHLVMDGSHGKTWIDPPGEAAKPPFYKDAPGVLSSNIPPADLPKTLPWQHLDKDGNPEAVTGKDAGVKAGQYFMGLKGTLYYVGHDPGNASTGYPFQIHKIVNGEFGGENYPYNPDLPGYYLEAEHQHVLPKPGDLPQFHPHEWVKSTEQKFMDQFATGEKFKLEGNAYEVTGKSGGKVTIKDLETGHTGAINGDYKSTWLQAHDGKVDPASLTEAPKFNVGDHVIGPDYKAVVDAVDEDGTVLVTPLHSNTQFDHHPAELTKVPSPAPVVGMTFPLRRPEDPPGSPKVKATVTKVLANGSIQVNLKPGKVVIPADEWEANAIGAYDPSAHLIGEKVKLRDLKPGDKFHGSAGNQTHRPYEVVFQTGAAKGGQKTYVRNLDTGEVTEMSAHKSYPTLDALKPDAPALSATKATPAVVTEGSVGPAYNPDAFALSGDKAAITEIPVGAMWQGSEGGVYKKIAHTDEHMTVEVVAPPPGADASTTMTAGETLDVPVEYASQVPMQLLESKTPWNPDAPAPAGDGWDAPLEIKTFVEGPDGVMHEKPATGFDPSGYIEGSKVKVGAMEGGTIFKTTSKNGDKYYQLSQDGAHTTNLLTGKVYDAKPHFKATMLHDQGDGAHPPEQIHGDPTIKYPAGSTVYFDPATKETGLDHAVVVGWDPAGKLLAVTSPDTGQTVFVGLDEIARGSLPDASAPPDEPGAAPSVGAVEAGKLPKQNAPVVPGTVVHGGGKLYVITGERDANGYATIHGINKSTGKYYKNPAGATLFNEHTPNAVGTVSLPVAPDTEPQITPLTGDAPNAEKVAQMKSSGHTFTAEKLPNGKTRYRVNGKVTHKASGVDYTHVTLWDTSKTDSGKPGDVGASFHKSASAAFKATSLGGDGYLTNKVATVAVTPHGEGAPDGETVPLHTLKAGDKFTTPGSKSVAQVVKNENGSLYAKSASLTDEVQGFPIPKTAQSMPVIKVNDAPDVGEEKAGNQKTASALGTNAEGKTFGELPVGSVFSPAHGGIKYKKLDADYAQKVGVGQSIGPDDTLGFDKGYVPDDLHTAPATDADIGKLATVTPAPGLSASMAWQGSITGHIKKVRESDGAVMLHNSVHWNKPEQTTIHDATLPPIKGGDVVHSEDGNTGTFVKWDSHPNGELAAVVDTTGNYDLEMWDPQSLTGIDPGTGMEQEGTLLHSKAHVPTPYDQLTQGDTTTIGQLQYGDVFKADGGDELYTLTGKPAPNASYEDQNFTIAPVFGANTGTPFMSNLTPTSPITFHAKEADYVPVEHPPLASEPTDYPDALGAGLVGFEDAFGGPYAHTQIGSMPQGTVFEDAAGNVWKVKQTGPTPVISGGPHHYTVDGSLWGKDLSQPNTQPPQHVDTAGPLGGGIETNMELAAAEHEVVPNTNGLTLGELHLKPGDYVRFGEFGDTASDTFVYEGKVGTGSQLETHKFKNVANGKNTFRGEATAPLSVSPSAFVSDLPLEYAPDNVAPPENGPPTLYTVPKELGAVGVGEKFTHGSGSSDVYEVTGHNAGTGEVLYKNSYGDQAKGGAGMPIHVMPAEPAPAPALNLPPKPEADPATLPPVMGPNGFAPPQPKPVLDPNFFTDSPLQPFTSRKGPGGVYSYPRLSETQVGQLFTDKTGHDYRVVAHGSSQTVFESVTDGTQYGAPSDHRVKLTALPPDPGPQLKPVVLDLTVKHGSLENVPKLDLNGHTSTYASDGKTKNPRLGHLKYGDVAYDADGHGVTFLGSWLDRALVLDHGTNDARLTDAGTRVSLKPGT